MNRGIRAQTVPDSRVICVATSEQASVQTAHPYPHPLAPRRPHLRRAAVTGIVYGVGVRALVQVHGREVDEHGEGPGAFVLGRLLAVGSAGAEVQESLCGAQTDAHEHVTAQRGGRAG